MDDKSALAGLVLYTMARKPRYRWIGLVSQQKGEKCWPSKHSRCAAIALRQCQGSIHFSYSHLAVHEGMISARFVRWSKIRLSMTAANLSEGEKVAASYGAPDKKFVVETERGFIQINERPCLRYRDGSLYVAKDYPGQLVLATLPEFAVRHLDIIVDVLNENSSRSHKFRVKDGAVRAYGDQRRRVQLAFEGFDDVVKLPGFKGELV